MASIENPSQAVLPEAAAAYQIGEHKGERGSEAEFAMLEERARANGLTLSEWVRDMLLSTPAEPGAEASEIVLAELLAPRSLFLNLRFRQGQGPMTRAGGPYMKKLPTLGCPIHAVPLFSSTHEWAIARKRDPF
jgi:hypothetical protein